MLTFVKKQPYLYEIPVSFLLLFAINQFFVPEFPGFVGIDPHPYWIVVLLFGFRYGVLAGFLTGILSAGLYLVLAWFFGEQYLFEDFAFYLLPIFFILGGALIGLGVNRYRVRIGGLTGEKGELKGEMSELQQEITTLKTINQNLEKRIVTRMATLVTLYEGARKLELASLNNVHQAIVEFVAKTLEAEEAAVYLKKIDGWVLETKYGWKDYYKRPSQFRFSEGLVGLAGSGNKIVSIRDFIRQQEGSPALLGDCLLAGPLRKGEEGEVVGVFAIHKMPFEAFNSATVNLFTFLLKWASRAIGRTWYLNALESKEVIDPEYQVYSYSYFESRAAQEFTRSKTYYLPLSMGFIQLVGLDKLSPTQRGNLLTLVSQLLKRCVREMDVLARSLEPEIPFAFLLLTISPAQAEETVQKIKDHFMKFNLPAVQLKVGLASFSPKTENVEQLIMEARQSFFHEKN